MRVNESTSFSRRHFLKQGAALAVGFSFSGLAMARVLGEITEESAAPLAKAKSLDATRVDAFLVLEGDGALTLYTGKVNLGRLQRQHHQCAGACRLCAQ